MPDLKQTLTHKIKKKKKSNRDSGAFMTAKLLKIGYEKLRGHSMQSEKTEGDFTDSGDLSF